MPTKTDRILGYLPGTFAAQPTRSALRAVADAFGGELQRGENVLAELMQAHWVDFADRGATAVDDLARMSVLYGLLPRDDETVERFRVHLKRYVRTLLGGTMTVQGVLRVAADALGLTVEDAAEALDSWWRRADDELVTVVTDSADAAEVLFGVADLDESGTAARRAELAGTPDFGAGVDLRDKHVLYVAVDGHAPAVVDLTAGVDDPSAVPLADVITRLTVELGDGVARADGGRLVLSSPTSGPDSRLEVREGPDDAATAVLGLLPLRYLGADAAAATLVGTEDLATGVDLTDARYLRLLVDGTHLAEIDCAAGDPAHTSLDQVRDAINTGLGIEVASHDGHRLTLTSPTTGGTSRIELQRAAAQDAAVRLFGVGPSARTGQDPRPAQYTGTPDLRAGVDLSEAALLRLRVDDLPTVTADCAGSVPRRTRLDEIVTAINGAIGAEVAAAVGGRLRLTSPSTGELAELALDPVSGDAAPVLLGLPPRLAEGTAATAAHHTGTTDLAGGVVVSSRHLLELAVDGGPFVPIELRGGSARATLDELVERINAPLDDDVATHDGEHLVLRSRHPGGGSRLRLRPVRVEHRRRFVTRAFVTGEAASALFGFDRGVARGDDESRAAVTGSADLSHGVDLSTAGYLRIGVDGRPPADVRVAGKRPRATVLDEIVPLLNDELRADDDPPIATHDGTRLSLRSPTAGAGSRIVFEVPRAQDARAVLLGDAPAFARGEDAGGVTLVGVTDLAGGVDLPAHAVLRIGVDGGTPADVALTGDAAGHRSVSALAATINAALGIALARHDGTHLALVSPTRGADAQLDLRPPADAAAVDATPLVLGITARTYRGSAARPAVITGTADVSGDLDLGVTRYLVLAVDGGAPVTVDCAAVADDPSHVGIADVATAVDSALGKHVASVVGGRLVLRSAVAGTAGRISVEPHTGGDARTALFGMGVPAETLGHAAVPAVLTGTADLLAPADLATRSMLLLRVDDGTPREIDVAGSAPAQTTLDEVVAAIDAVLPGVAAPTTDRRLRLTSPTAGPASRVEVLPVRCLEVVEYPPEDRTPPVRWLRHGDVVTVDNDGAGEVFLTVRIEAPHGNGGPALVNRDTGRFVAMTCPLDAGDAATIWRDHDGRVRASIESPAGTPPVAVPATDLCAGRLGAWTSVATPSDDPHEVPSGGLQLGNPWAAGVDVVLPRVSTLTVEVAPAAVTVTGLDPNRRDGDTVTLTATLRRADDGWHLHGHGDVDLIIVRQGPDVEFAGQDGAVVGVVGVLRADEQPYLLVTAMSRRFDVTLGADGVEPESYGGVTIGAPSGPDAFADRVTGGTTPSRLARVRTEATGDALRLHRGRTTWQVLECLGSRLDSAVFGGGGVDHGHHTGRFAGGRCRWPGVFDISTFARPDDVAGSVFASAADDTPPTGWTLSWPRHTPGAFEVNLPADLPARFGGRFDEARFASNQEQPADHYPNVVTEPPDDDDNLVALVNARSTLVRAEPVATLPIGFTAVPLPTRTPRHLTGGFGSNAARVYLQEQDTEGYILLEARQHGPDGNLISVSSRPAGPARFDVTIATEGARFESARAIVAGPLPVLTDRSTLEPTPLGVAEAKAAGIRVRVTRDRSGP